jgi:hypothetical protein
MRARRRASTGPRCAGTILGALLLLGASVAGTAPKEEHWTIFRAYPGARRLCNQHVSGTTMHINWTLYATADDPDRVRRFYEKNTSGAAVEKEGGKLVGLRGPKQEVLSIHGVKERYPSCGVAPSARDRTAIVVSQAT